MTMRSAMQMTAFGLAACLAGLTSATALAQAPQLADPVAQLQPVAVDAANADVSVTVSLDGDTPDATHVVIRPHGTNRVLQRTPDGFFVPWDGNTDHLIDSGFQPSADGSMTYKVFRQDLRSVLMPVTVVLLYRSGDTLKSGQFIVEGTR